MYIVMIWFYMYSNEAHQNWWIVVQFLWVITVKCCNRRNKVTSNLISNIISFESKEALVQRLTSQEIGDRS